MDEKAVRAVGAGWVLLLAAAVAGWGSFVVGRWNDVFGATNARWAGPGTLLWGALLALLCALVASGASALTHTARWVTRLGTAVVVLAFLGPMASTQAHIEWRRAQPSAEEQEALLEQEMHELQEKHAEVGPTAPVITVTGPDDEVDEPNGAGS